MWRGAGANRAPSPYYCRNGAATYSRCSGYVSTVTNGDSLLWRTQFLNSMNLPSFRSTL